jgi:hypothetical protein
VVGVVVVVVGGVVVDVDFVVVKVEVPVVDVWDNVEVTSVREVLVRLIDVEIVVFGSKMVELGDPVGAIVGI